MADARQSEACASMKQHGDDPVAKQPDAHPTAMQPQGHPQTKQSGSRPNAKEPRGKKPRFNRRPWKKPANEENKPVFPDVANRSGEPEREGNPSASHNIPKRTQRGGRKHRRVKQVEENQPQHADSGQIEDVSHEELNKPPQSVRHENEWVSHAEVSNLPVPQPVTHEWVNHNGEVVRQQQRRDRIPWVGLFDDNKSPQLEGGNKPPQQERKTSQWTTAREMRNQKRQYEAQDRALYAEISREKAREAKAQRKKGQAHNGQKHNDQIRASQPRKVQTKGSQRSLQPNRGSGSENDTSDVALAEDGLLHVAQIMDDQSVKDQANQPNKRMAAVNQTATSNSETEKIGFLTLPAEVRNPIYEGVFDRSLQVQMMPRGPKWRIPEAHRQTTAVLTIDKSGQPVRRWDAERPQVRYPKSLGSYHSYKPTRTRWGHSFSGLLLTCRQVFEEAAPFLYASTSFFFQSTNRLHKFVSVVRPWNLSFVKTLRLDYVSYGEPRMMDHLQWKVRHDQKWDDTCALVVQNLPNLENLKLTLHLVECPLLFEFDQPWMQPILRFSDLSKLQDVQVNLKTVWSKKDVFGDRELAAASRHLHQLFAEAIRRKILIWDEQVALEEYREWTSGDYWQWRNHLPFNKTKWRRRLPGEAVTHQQPAIECPSDTVVNLEE